METERSQHRIELRDALVAAATRTIAENGNKALRARDLATEVGCALGSIYNVFSDMDALVLAVRTQTLDRLEAEVIARLGPFEATTAGECEARLSALAEVYMEFAHENWRLWSAAFEHSSAETPELATYLARLNAIFVHIETPLVILIPDIGAEKRASLARALFASVHGIVRLALDQALGEIAVDQLKWQVQSILSAVLAGFRVAPPE